MNKTTTHPQKVIGFDYGKKHTGVAYGQTLTKLATPLTTIKATKDAKPPFEDIKEIINKWSPEALIVGIPLNMDGSEQDMTILAKKFAKQLKEKFNLPIFEIDERLTTWEAKNNLGIHYKGATSKEDQKKVNAEAAAILVEQWLTSVD